MSQAAESKVVVKAEIDSRIEKKRKRCSVITKEKYQKPKAKN